MSEALPAAGGEARLGLNAAIRELADALDLTRAPDRLT